MKGLLDNGIGGDRSKVPWDRATLQRIEATFEACYTAGLCAA